MSESLPSLSARRPWYSLKRVVIPLLVFVPPIGAIPMWLATRWPLWVKIPLTVWAAIILAVWVTPKTDTASRQATSTPTLVAVAAQPTAPAATAVPTAAPTVRPPTATPLPLSDPENPERVAFLDYGKKLWKAGVDSDRYNTTMLQALGQATAAGAGRTYTAAKDGRDGQQGLFGESIRLRPPDRAKKAHEALNAMLLRRKDLAEKVMAFLDSKKASDQSAMETTSKDAQTATLMFATEMAKLASDFGVDLSELQ